MEKNWWLVTIKSEWGSFWNAVYSNEEDIKEVVNEHRKNGYKVIIEKLGNDGQKHDWP